MQLDPQTADPAQIYKLLIGCVVPRPIAWVSSIDAQGVRNLAPFSFFMGITGAPPTIAFASSPRRDGSGAVTRKDTLRNVQAMGEFVVNVVDDDRAEAMNLTSGEYAPEVDEFAVAGLTAAPSVKVKAPRLAEAPINMECRVVQIVPVGNGPSHLVIGEIVHFHLRDDVYDART
ncbi:MAG: flavin reductase family protein, partial [Candidatus Rokubacteria bacterium]|nr:flavin reductase family protein [Candidatus Rokubacteria bacterium]